MKEATPNRLKELRDRSRLTQEEVSMITGYSIATISRHESGSRKMDMDAIDRYAKLYKVRTYELFVDPGVETEPYYGDEDGE